MHENIVKRRESNSNFISGLYGNGEIIKAQNAEEVKKAEEEKVSTEKTEVEAEKK